MKRKVSEKINSCATEALNIHRDLDAIVASMDKKFQAEVDRKLQRVKTALTQLVNNLQNISMENPNA